MKTQYWYYKGSDIIGDARKERAERERERRKRLMEKGRLNNAGIERSDEWA